jgi:hypothetical protein
VDLDWKDLGLKVIGLGAPVLGTALGGPFGAVAGKLLAEVLGTADATPEAVDLAIMDRHASSVPVADAMQQAEHVWVTALADAAKEQVSQVGQTQRAEITSGDRLQRWWRPVYALELSLIECPAFALTLLRALWLGDAPGIDGFGNLSALLIAYFAARFGVLGVYVSGRTREKQASAMGAAEPNMVNEFLKAVVKKK